MMQAPKQKNSLPDAFFDAMMKVVGVAERLARNVNAGLREGELSIPQQRVLGHLRSAGDSVHRSIGRALGMGSAQVSRDTKQLIERGLLTSERSPHHKLQFILSLTDTGRELADSSHQARLDVFKREFEKLIPDDQSVIERALLQTQNSPPRSGTETIYRPVLVRQLPSLLNLFSQGVQAELVWNDDYIGYLLQLMAVGVARSGGRPVGWMALKGRQITGACVWIPGRSLDDEHGDDGHAMIGAFFVPPAFRLGGIGQELLKRCCEDAQERCETLIVTAPQRQQALTRLLRKYRFQRQGSAEPRYIFGKMEKLVDMRLNLSVPLRPVRRQGSGPK